MSVCVRIGTWHEKSREITRCPSYYAADHETLQTTAGDYPLELMFQNGYNIPMPYWLLVNIPSIRIDGALYSGFGGVNYARNELPKGESVLYHVQTYDYLLKDLVAKGTVTLNPGFEWLLLKRSEQFKDPRSPKTWEEVIAMRDATAQVVMA